MKYTQLAALLMATALATPIDSEVKRQSGGSISNDLTLGSCRPITFIFARGSTEPGNMASKFLGSTVGPATCSALQSRYGSTNVACQGVGGAYLATIQDNILPQGTTTAAIGEAQRMLELAQSKCPSSIVVAGGYSQGAAVMTAALGSTLDDAARTQVVAAVLYGDTRNFETGGTIPGYPTEDTLILCNPTDGVCGAGLVVTAGHLTYVVDVPEATEFFGQRIDAAQ